MTETATKAAMKKVQKIRLNAELEKLFTSYLLMQKFVGTNAEHLT